MSYPHDRPAALFEQLVARPAAEVPLDEAVLLLAACRRPDLDLLDELARLDELAAACPSPTLDGLLRHVFGPLGFSGNTLQYDDPDNSFLDQVLTRRVGIPISLAVLTMEVGRRVGVPLEGIGLPGHFVLHHRGSPDVYVDVFDRGRTMGELAVRSLYRRVSGGSDAWDPAWLRPVDHHQILLRMLANLRASFLARGDLGALRWVMRLRCALPGVPPTESAEFARLMAATN